MTNKLIGIVMVLGFGAVAQVNLTGTVSDAAGGSPLPGVAVALKTLGISDTTDAQGKYQIIATRSTWPGPSSAKGISGSRIVGNLLRLNISKPSPVTVELFNATGVKITTLFKDADLSEGTYAINLSASGVAPGLYLIRVRQGNQTWIHRYLPVQTALQSNLTNNGIRKGMAKRLDASSAIDTLVFSKIGYGLITIPIQSYTGIIDTALVAILSAPSISSAMPGDGSVTVTWGAVTGATSYNLYFNTGTTVDKATGSRLTGAASPKQVAGLTNGTQYAFAVSAVNTGGESGLSNVITATPQAIPVISTVVAGNGSATVTWNAVTGATSYNLYFNTGTTVDKATGSRLTGVTSPKLVAGLTNGTQYAFAVSAVNAGGESGLSGIVTATPQVAAPSAPVISGVVAGDGSATVSWGAVTGATSYNLYYKAGTTVDMTSGTKLTGVTSLKQVTGLTNGTQYAFAVSAVNVGGESELSSIVTATPNVVDIDGNVYHTITIGTQVWMVENLKTTRYNDGTAIPLVTDSTAWAALTTPGYCWYNDDSATYKSTYGAIYNWYAVNTVKLAPTGWHVPTDSEWTVLTTYLGGESVAGGPLKETGTTHWISPNTGATNTTGFSALPGGYRNFNGAFNLIGNYGYWWSSMAFDATTSWLRIMYSYNANVFRYNLNDADGLSVRCLRNP
jgi:uncharacterized protein (TIGR02145 family)